MSRFVGFIQETNRVQCISVQKEKEEVLLQTADRADARNHARRTILLSRATLERWLPKSHNRA